MKRFLIALAMACALCTPAFAGDIPTAGIASASAGEPHTTNTTSPGDIPTAGFAQQSEDALLGGFLAVVGWLI